MKKKLIILFLTFFCFSALIKASFVQAQTSSIILSLTITKSPSVQPTTPIQSSVDEGVVFRMLKILFEGSGANQDDTKSVDEYQQKYLTPGAQNTVAPGQSATPGPSPTPNANSECNTARKGYFACRLIEEIRRVCGGRVTSANANCLDNLNIPGVGSNVMSPAIAEMKSSAISTGALQCVGFVKGALYIMSGGDGAMLQSRGNAIDWIGNSPNTYAAIKNDGTQKLQDGDVPIWGYDTYGHIAIYIGDGQIAEGNFDANGLVNMRPVNENSPALVGWLRPL